MTKTEIFDTVVEIQELLWKSDDLMDQEILFLLQDKVATFALELAESEKKQKDLVQRFPWLYTLNEKGGSK